MRAKKIIAVACMALALVMVAGITGAQAQECCYFNPLFLPFAVAGAVLGTAAAIATAPFYPYPGPGYYGPGYYGPGPYPRRVVAVPGHYGPGGVWVPAHRRARVWVPGHHDPYGGWTPGHWGLGRWAMLGGEFFTRLA